MDIEFPSERTTVVVIHGIGDQKPFETLDAFTRGMIRYLNPQPGELQLDHKLCFHNVSHGADWVESYIRLRPTDAGDDRWLDIHEFYWAHLTQDKISVRQVRRWLNQTLQGAIDSYEENQAYLRKHHPDLIQKQNRPYWWRLNTILRRLWFVFPLVRLLEFLVLQWLPSWVPLPGFLKQTGTRVIVDFVGDVAIYTSTEKKSSYYTLRQQILKESQTFIEEILANPACDRVIIAGHSLGSVIAFDTLNRLNMKANNSNQDQTYRDNLRKIKGLVTFGSPLDKILFYFRQKAGEQQIIRQQLLDHIHAFKRKQTEAMQLALKDAVDQTLVLKESPVRSFLDHLWWLNFYDDQDPISGHLDFYAIPEENNVRLDLQQSWGVAHNYYWGHLPLHQRVLALINQSDVELTQTPG